jgi:hypothetical protein
MANRTMANHTRKEHGSTQIYDTQILPETCEYTCRINVGA